MNAQIVITILTMLIILMGLISANAILLILLKLFYDDIRIGTRELENLLLEEDNE